VEEGRAEGGGQSGQGDGGAWMVDVMLKLCLQSLGVVAARIGGGEEGGRGVRGGAGAAASQDGGGGWLSERAEEVGDEGLEAQVAEAEARVASLRAHVEDAMSALQREEEVRYTTNAQVESLHQIRADSHRLVKERDALHQRLPTVEAVLAAEHPIHPAIEEGRECVVCWSRTSEIALVPCGHVCLCRSCPPLSACPMCRAQVTSSLRVYLN